ncbi:MAG: exopolysaccharide biosynthesis protein, partial [Waterburya sp.]
MQLRFSQDIETLLKRLANQPLTIGDILAQTSERGFSVLIVLLALPFLSPVMPPGLSTISGFGCILIGLQMALGIRKLWLPRKIYLFKFPPKFSSQLLKSL